MWNTDADTGVLVAPSPVGGAATFVWNTLADARTAPEAGDACLLRITPYDTTGNVGRPAYLDAPIVIGAGR